MKREFFCEECGLFHWDDQYVMDPVTGRIDWNPKASNCPNPLCNGESGIPVDSFGFAYFCDSEEGKKALQKTWSAPEYAPDDAIEIYRNQGVRIEE